MTRDARGFELKEGFCSRLGFQYSQMRSLLYFFLQSLWGLHPAKGEIIEYEVRQTIRMWCVLVIDSLLWVDTQFDLVIEQDKRLQVKPIFNLIGDTADAVFASVEGKDELLGCVCELVTSKAYTLSHILLEVLNANKAIVVAFDQLTGHGCIEWSEPCATSAILQYFTFLVQA